jgi:hypothetical protein
MGGLWSSNTYQSVTAQSTTTIEPIIYTRRHQDNINLLTINLDFKHHSSSMVLDFVENGKIILTTGDHHALVSPVPDDMLDVLKNRPVNPLCKKILVKFLYPNPYVYLEQGDPGVLVVSEGDLTVYDLVRAIVSKATSVRERNPGVRALVVQLDEAL